MGILRFLTAGESHGQGLTAVIEGVPAGLEISEDYILRDLARRQLGYGRGGRMKIEKDRAQITAGVRHGQTLGSPVSLYVENKDWVNWQQKMSVEPVEDDVQPVTRLRPGHADLAGVMKYSQSDVRNILERASARETAARVAVGSVAKRLIEEFGMHVHSHVISIGDVRAPNDMTVDWTAVEESPVRCANSETSRKMVEAIKAAKHDADTLGGVVEVVATGVPVGLGSHVQWDRKLDGCIAQAMMSIHAVKGVSIGDGWEGASWRGSQVHDVIEPLEKGESFWRRSSNHAGGLEGGMTTGQSVVVRFALKPISTLAKPLPSVDLITGEKVQAHYERSDVCVVPAAGVIGEAMLAIILAGAFLEKFGGDHISETRRNLQGYLATIGPRFGASHIGSSQEKTGGLMDADTEEV